MQVAVVSLHFKATMLKAASAGVEGPQTQPARVRLPPNAVVHPMSMWTAPHDSPLGIHQLLQRRTREAVQVDLHWASPQGGHVTITISVREV